MKNRENKSNEDSKKEDDVMDAATIRKIDKKKLLKSLQGIATSPIDFNKIRNEQKYGKD